MILEWSWSALFEVEDRSEPKDYEFFLDFSIRITPCYWCVLMVQVDQREVLVGNLRLKSGIYHWWLTVPPDLTLQIGKRELVRSTGTSDKRLAQRYAMEWSAEAKRAFEELRRGKAASSAEMTAVERRLLTKELARQDKCESIEHRSIEYFGARDVHLN